MSSCPNQHKILVLALTEARLMRAWGAGPRYLAKALLNYHNQSSFFLREVLQAAQEYLPSG